MKYRSFKLTHKRASNLLEYGVLFGELDITTSFLWWSRTETRQIYRYQNSSGWRFLDTGDFTEDISCLESAYDAQTALTQLKAQNEEKTN